MKFSTFSIGMFFDAVKCTIGTEVTKEWELVRFEELLRDTVPNFWIMKTLATLF